MITFLLSVPVPWFFSYSFTFFIVVHMRLQIVLKRKHQGKLELILPKIVGLPSFAPLDWYYYHS
ncbi:hypothetical protein ASPFODRAFT_49792 [Aspergillus luchuensis CBS 106.47]|uniref:Uncharacterized protein n=1 Tax=Aspergillus luchuensis (strain CBS 106.47) TaxID=1137211 RepID=A0A1M3T8X5_ASPLC|nr:hypothetical protein ASPFODRAFT_49792 [Aspergillus luchuensis CBS 106.47]